MRPASILRKLFQSQAVLGITLLTAWSGGLIGYGFLSSHWQTTIPQPPQIKTEGSSIDNLRSPISASHSPIPRAQHFTTFNQVHPVPAGKFYYSGNSVWSPIHLGLDSAIQAERREFQFTALPILEKKGETAIERLKTGQVSFIQATQSPQETRTPSASPVQSIPVAYDGIAFAVHPSLPLSGLTFHQLAKIYCGRVTNWKDVGGPDLAIQPIALDTPSDPMVKRFEKDVLRFRPFGPNLKVLPTSTTAIHHLAATPGGIFFGSAATIVPQCAIKPLAIGRKPGQLVTSFKEPLVPSSRCPQYRNQINAEAFQSQQYPLTQQLSVVFEQSPQSGQPVGQAYAKLLLTDQGQTLMARVGFAPVK